MDVRSETVGDDVLDLIAYRPVGRVERNREHHSHSASRQTRPRGQSKYLIAYLCGLKIGPRFKSPVAENALVDSLTGQPISCREESGNDEHNHQSPCKECQRIFSCGNTDATGEDEQDAKQASDPREMPSGECGRSPMHYHRWRVAAHWRR